MIHPKMMQRLVSNIHNQGTPGKSMKYLNRFNLPVDQLFQLAKDIGSATKEASNNGRHSR